jgi:hypothetical protein
VVPVVPGDRRVVTLGGTSTATMPPLSGTGWVTSAEATGWPGRLEGRRRRDPREEDPPGVVRPGHHTGGRRRTGGVRPPDARHLPGPDRDTRTTSPSRPGWTAARSTTASRVACAALRDPVRSSRRSPTTLSIAPQALVPIPGALSRSRLRQRTRTANSDSETDRLPTNSTSPRRLPRDPATARSARAPAGSCAPGARRLGTRRAGAAPCASHPRTSARRPAETWRRDEWSCECGAMPLHSLGAVRSEPRRDSSARTRRQRARADRHRRPQPGLRPSSSER